MSRPRRRCRAGTCGSARAGSRTARGRRRGTAAPGRGPAGCATSGAMAATSTTSSEGGGRRDGGAVAAQSLERQFPRPAAADGRLRSGAHDGLHSALAPPPAPRRPRPGSGRPRTCSAASPSTWRERRLLGRASCLRARAARVEPAARRRIDRRRRIARAGSRSSRACGALRVGDRHADSSARVYGMPRVLVERRGRRQLDDRAEVHHRDAVADVAHDRQVVRDEEIGQAQFAPAGRRAG